MILTVQPEAPPLRIDDRGVVRVGSTRILLDLVIRAYQLGATPEAIVQAYDSLSLSDVYSVIAFYLRHTREVDAYLAASEAEGRAIRASVRPNGKDLSAIRARLEAARLARG
jgi:uncharacterized protein (DUF433 family)